MDPSQYLGSKVIHPSTRFVLSNLEDDMSSALLVVKKENIPPFLPPKKTQLDLVVKTPMSHKRKSSDV